MAEDHGPFPIWTSTIYYLFRHVFEGDGVMRLLDGKDGVSFGLEGMYGVEGVFVILPFDGLFGAKGCLMDLRVRRTTTNAAEDDALDTHGVCGTKDRTDIMLAADVVEDDYQRQFVGFFVLVYIHPPHLGGRQFLTHS